LVSVGGAASLLLLLAHLLAAHQHARLLGKLLQLLLGLVQELGHLDINLVGLETLHGLGKGLHGRLDSLLHLLVCLGLLGLGLLFNLMQKLLELLGCLLLETEMTRSLLHLSALTLRASQLHLLLVARRHPGRRRTGGTGSPVHFTGDFFRNFLIKLLFGHFSPPFA